MEEKIRELIKRHEEYKLSGINLIASENRISVAGSSALASDLAGRYGNEWYGGARYAIEIFEETEKLARKLFKAKYVFINPISGNICDLAMIFSFTKCRDMVAGIPKEEGGYPFGYGKFERKFYPLPVKDYVVDEKRLKKIDVPLALVASSIILFPHPLKKISERINGVIAYDASHVLGLIAGGEFQKPLEEGADVVIASTHKSFPGPQGGIIFTNDSEVAEKISPYVSFDYEGGIALIDNPHMHRIASLGIVMEEMIKNGKKYAKNIVKNARALAKSLNEILPIKFPEKNFTESHQILIDLPKEKIEKIFKDLEKNHIFIDCIGRIGVAEATYIGMDEKDMEEISNFIVDAIRGKNVKKEVTKFAMKFYA
ncbi:MAG: serine hydroxymethyltransferase [Thermoplasmatales archaeon]|nr:serine hydroxymethyltransferase [Thermoplasmatales archaeon]